MKILIVGAGTIGINLAKSLSEENHNVYLIESNEKIASKTNEKLDVQVITGSACDPNTLTQIGIEQFDLVIAVTNSDEINLVVCSLTAAFGVKQRIARVRNSSLNKTITEKGKQFFNVSESFNPELVAAEAIAKVIEAPGASDVADFAQGKILLRSFAVPKHSPLCNMQIKDFKENDFPWPFLIVALSRNRSILIPKGNDFIQASDKIYVLLPRESLGEFLTFINPEVRRPKKIVIYGATIIGEKVATALSDHVREIIVLEENEKRAEDVAGRLKSARVIHGSASETDILKECGIEAADVFIGTSPSDHSNLISAVLAKKMGAKTTIITTRQLDHMAIVDALAINVVINPRLLAVDMVLKLVRGEGVSAVTKLSECNAEILELIPEENSLITKAPLKDISFPAHSIVGAVHQGQDILLAKGDTQISAGQGVIVFCRDDAVRKVQKLFIKKKLF